jgi:hypothetical protein
MINTGPASRPSFLSADPLPTHVRTAGRPSSPRPPHGCPLSHSLAATLPSGSPGTVVPPPGAAVLSGHRGDDRAAAAAACFPPGMVDHGGLGTGWPLSGLSVTLPGPGAPCTEAPQTRQPRGHGPTVSAPSGALTPPPHRPIRRPDSGSAFTRPRPITRPRPTGALTPPPHRPIRRPDSGSAFTRPRPITRPLPTGTLAPPRSLAPPLLTLKAWL